jgi:hypothetical protein
MGVPPGNRRVLVSVPEWYGAGAETRGRPEGRPYPWSQQAIHETSGLNLSRKFTSCQVVRIWETWSFSSQRDFVRANSGHRAPNSKFKVQSFKFENTSEFSDKTWNLEPGTLNLILLYAVSCNSPAVLCHLAQNLQTNRRKPKPPVEAWYKPWPGLFMIPCRLHEQSGL